MPDQQYAEILYPTPRQVEAFHNVIILQRGVSGWVSKGMVEGCIEWAKTDIYNFVPFPSLLERGAAMMYAYVTFHPFSDGNKRTALMVTSFFFFLNGFIFTIKDDTPDFMLDVAKRCLDSDRHSPTTEIARIAGWLRQRTSAPIAVKLLYRLLRLTTPSGVSSEVVLRNSGWETYFEAWLEPTTKRIGTLWKRKNHHTS